MPLRPHNRLGFQEPKSNKLLTFTSTNLRGKLKPMHQMQMANPPLSNSNKATKAYGGIREEEQRRELQVLQISPRSRSKGIPSQRGDFDWWKCRSRSPLSFLSNGCKNHWREREIARSKRSAMGGKNELGEMGNLWGRRPLK